jgi:hypothetical protein
VRVDVVSWRVFVFDSIRVSTGVALVRVCVRPACQCRPSVQQGLSVSASQQPACVSRYCCGHCCVQILLLTAL